MAAALPIASLALAGAGTAMNVMGRSQQAQAQAGQANYMAQVARNNQIAAQRSAALATEQGEVQAQNRQLRTAGIEGSQRAALASQGGDVNAGSDLDIVGDTARAGASDVATIRSNAAQKAYGYALQADDAAGTANDAGFQAADATARLPYSIGSSLLGSASSLAGRYAGWSRPGGLLA